ncbi:MAG TPA: winged helix DNA-binding domain-containing protein [Candidatus Eisenbergiella stercoravium]|nr:winged helix DNA-binding domain-containing protein [Candidatus Eisenbergiella stercoravium]
MNEPNLAQIRAFRLRAHHLDRTYAYEDIPEAVGACGMQNTPPGAWENALYHRIPSCSLVQMEQLLYGDPKSLENSGSPKASETGRMLLQAWSLRGAPFVFPVSESGAFLSALIPQTDEPWIYTRGITLALDYLGMEMEPLLELLKQVMIRLDNAVITGKNSLDQTLAEWMLPLLPKEKQALWNQPSMYGEPDRQTVGGAVVSFLLRPCAFCGLVVFGRRLPEGPSFTSFRNWLGTSLPLEEAARKKAQKALVRKYLHCYGPAVPAMFADWLGCSKEQARRLWAAVSEEMEEVRVCGKRAWILAADHDSLFSVPDFSRPLLLLNGYDPYLDQRDRAVLQPDRTLQRKIWRTVSNPGAVIFQGKAVGIWASRKKGSGLDVEVTLWKDAEGKLSEEAALFRELSGMVEEWSAFRGLSIRGIRIF